MREITIRIKLFGALRERNEKGEISVQLPSGASLQELRLAAAPQLGELIFESALADETCVLSEQTRLESPLLLAALPPVCGG
jgi:hypothetical protein